MNTRSQIRRINAQQGRPINYGLDGNEECQMYTLCRDGNPVAYRYGEPWVAQQLLMEGGYKTPEEAKKAWEKGGAE